jgi:hypothetical protein
LWKSLVLPAGGVALCWLLVMSLLLVPLDHARSYRSLIERIAQQVPRDACIAAPGMSRAQLVALERLGGYLVDGVTAAAATKCPYLLLMETRDQPSSPGPGWQLLARERRNNSDDEITAIYRRAVKPAS